MKEGKAKNIFAVCDLEVEYAYNFMEYMNRKHSIPFEIQAFTDTAVLCEFGKDKKIEILLISDKAVNEEVRRLKIGQLIILSEGVHYPGLDQYPSVYKYQASDMLVREVMACYCAEQNIQAEPVAVKRNMKTIGIYSPVGRAQKTSFALTMGEILSKEQAVLYLNLESYAGFEQIFGKEYDATLSDLLYYARQENQNLIYKMGTMVQTLGNLDYLPPAQTPGDIQGTTFEEWHRLLQEIQNNSNYEVVILDLGDGVQDLFRVLALCDVVYEPIQSDMISEAKQKQFEALLTVWDFQEVLEHLRPVKLPYHQSARSGAMYFDELVWSELGDYIRRLLNAEKWED